MLQNTSFGNTSGGRNESCGVTAANELHNNANSDADGGEVPHCTALHFTWFDVSRYCTMWLTYSAWSVSVAVLITVTGGSTSAGRPLLKAPLSAAEEVEATWCGLSKQQWRWGVNTSIIDSLKSLYTASLFSRFSMHYQGSTARQDRLTNLIYHHHCQGILHP